MRNIHAPGDLFSKLLAVSLCEQVEESAGEVVGVSVGVTELVTDRVQEQIPTWTRETCWLTELRSS